MPLGVISYEDLLKELGSLDKSNSLNNDIDEDNIINDKPNPNPTPHDLHDEVKTLGRGLGTKNIDPEVRKRIAELSITSDMSGKELAERFNVSPSSVSAYKNGSTSTTTYNQPDKDLKNHIKNVKSNLRKKARRVLTGCLDELTPERISKAKAIEVASIARSMSSIHRDLEDNDDQDKNKGNLNVQFIMMQPPVHNEAHYDAIDVQVLDSVES